MEKKHLKNSHFHFLLIIGLILSNYLNSCSQEEAEKEDKKYESGELYNRLVKVNQYLVKRNRELVENFIRRTEWDMKNTQTGLWYMITDKGNGKEVMKGDEVIISYRIRLLDGTVLTSDSDRITRSFIVGNGRVEAGLEEGVSYMREGGEAKFILPPHLAHGNFGDIEKVPPGSVLLYDVELVEVIGNR